MSSPLFPSPSSEFNRAYRWPIMRTQAIAAIALLLQLHSCAAAPTPDSHDVEGAPAPTSPEKRSSTLELPPEWLEPEDWTATTTDSAKRSLFSGINWLDCPAIARRGGPIPKRCLSETPMHIGTPIWDEYDGEIGTATDSAKRSLYSGTGLLDCPEIARRGGPTPKRCESYLPLHIGIPVWDEDGGDGVGAWDESKVGTITGTATDSAKRSFFSSVGHFDTCLAIARRGESLPKRCLEEPDGPLYPFRIGTLEDTDSSVGKRSPEPFLCPIVDRRAGFVVRRCAMEQTGTVTQPPFWSGYKEPLPLASDRRAAPSVNRRIPPKCIPNGSGGCTEDTISSLEDWPFDEEMPSIAAVARDTSEKKRIVLQPGMEPIDTPTHVGDLTLHIGRSDSDSNEKRYACPIIDRRSDGTVVRSCLDDPLEPIEPIEPITSKLNFTSIIKDPQDPPPIFDTPITSLAED